MKKKMKPPKVDRSNIVVKSSPIHGKGVFAAKPVKKGDALIEYSLDVEGKVTKQLKKDYECRCGAKKCRGTMLALD